MIDAHIPAGVLPPEAERELLSKVTEMVVRHEIRRTVDIDPELDADTLSADIIDRAKSIAWLFVHRPEIYVGGESTTAPYYKFHITVPGSQNDEVFRAASVRDVTALVAHAEGGRWPNPERRVWVFTSEVPDGSWGAVGQIVHLGDVLSFVLGRNAHAEGAQRVHEHHREQARALLQVAGTLEPSTTA